MVLKGLSFRIAPGEFVGVCGRTGAGKSSVLVVLLRLVDAEAGSVRMDGVGLPMLVKNAFSLCCGRFCAFKVCAWGSLNSCAHVRMRVVCVRPRPKISFGAPNDRVCYGDRVRAGVRVFRLQTPRRICK